MVRAVAVVVACGLALESFLQGDVVAGMVLAMAAAAAGAWIEVRGIRAR